jgi:hypothetical protein
MDHTATCWASPSAPRFATRQIPRDRIVQSVEPVPLAARYPDAVRTRMPSDYDQLIAKLRKIEQLFARPGTDGERQAARHASDRIRARLESIERAEPVVEVRFSMADAWSRSLFVALLRRHGLQPYRYRGQRYTTVMVRVTRSFVDETLWPEYLQLQAALVEHLEAVTRKVIADAFGGSDEVEVREG